MVPEMIGHYNGIVYNNTKRNGYPGKRVKMQLEPEQVIENKGHGKICNKAYGNYCKVLKLTTDNKHKDQQQYNRGNCTIKHFQEFLFKRYC